MIMFEGPKFVARCSLHSFAGVRCSTKVWCTLDWTGGELALRVFGFLIEKACMGCQGYLHATFCFPLCLADIMRFWGSGVPNPGKAKAKGFFLDDLQQFI